MRRRLNPVDPDAPARGTLHAVREAWLRRRGYDPKVCRANGRKGADEARRRRLEAVYAGVDVGSTG